MIPYTSDTTELEAHIQAFRSTIDTYLLVEYERQTPTELGKRAGSFFDEKSTQKSTDLHLACSDFFELFFRQKNSRLVL